MEFFPFRRDRVTSDAVMDRMRADIEAHGYGWTALEITETGECAGFVGLKPIEVDGIGGPGAHEIGWRLAPEFWGKGYVTEAASALLDFAFTRAGLNEVLSFAVWNNERSIAVMRRLGMRRRGEFDHPGVPDTHPELKRHHLYAIRRDEWREPAMPAAL